MTKLNLTYEFDLDDDMWDYQNLVNANKYRSMLNEIFAQFRLMNKHYSDDGNWAEAYDMLWKIAKDENINPWEEIF